MVAALLVFRVIYYWMPLVSARSALICLYKMAIQRKVRRKSFEVLRTRFGTISRVSRSKSGC